MEEKGDLNEMLGEDEGAMEEDDVEPSQDIAGESVSEETDDMGLIEEDFSFTEGQQAQPVVADGLEELLADVELEVIIELGRNRKALRDIYDLKIGTIVELDKQAREPIDILVNNSPVARGEVMVFEDALAVRVTEILTPAELVKKN